MNFKAQNLNNGIIIRYLPLNHCEKIFMQGIRLWIISIKKFLTDKINLAKTGIARLPREHPYRKVKERNEFHNKQVACFLILNSFLKQTLSTFFLKSYFVKIMFTFYRFIIRFYLFLLKIKNENKLGETHRENFTFGGRK